MINTVYTIGHSTHSAKEFIELLKQHGITAVVDVRSAPYSRFNDQFNKGVLSRMLKSNGIKYIFLGKELGARSDDPDCYENGKVSYSRLAGTTLFQEGMGRVRTGSENYLIALMCAEKEPLECHRTLLVAKELNEQGYSVLHILADGKLETHEDAMLRLLDVVGLPRGDLFGPEEELIPEAIALQQDKVAYVDEELAIESSSKQKLPL